MNPQTPNPVQPNAPQTPATRLTPQLSTGQLMQNIDAMKKQGAQTPDIQSYVNNYDRSDDGSYTVKGYKAPAPEPSTISKMGSDLMGGVNSAVNLGKDYISGQATPSKVAGTAADITGAPIKAVGELVPPKIKAMGSAVGGAVGGVVNWLGDKIGSTQAAQDFVTKHPDAANALEEIVKTIGSTAEGAGNVAALASGVKATPGVVKDSVGVVKSGVGDIVQGVKEGVNKITGAAQPLIKKGVNAITDKTSAELSTIPKSEVPNLSTSDQAAWHRLKQVDLSAAQQAEKDALNATHEANTTKATAEQTAAQKALEQKHIDAQNALESERIKALETHRTATNAAAEQSVKDLKAQKDQVTAVTDEKALAAKPAVLSAFSRAGKTYTDLFEQDMAPHANVPVTHQEAADALDKAFPSTPEMPNNTAETFKTKLGLQSDPSDVTPATGKDGLPSINATPGKAPATTIGELYSKIKGLRSEMSTAGKKGTRVYSANDVNIDKAVNALSGILKDKGLDLSRANNFWRQHAPVRDAIVSKVKPFNDEAGLKTKTFSNILKNVASESPEPENVRFVKALEEMTGQSFSDDVKVAAQKLTDAQRKVITDKITAAEKEMDIKDAADAKASALKEQSKSQTESLKEQGKNTMSALNKEHSGKVNEVDTKYSADKETLKQQEHDAGIAKRRQARIKQIIVGGLAAFGIGEGIKLL